MALKKNILISFGMNGAVYFFQFLTTVVVSRLLTPEQVGQFAVSMAIVSVLQGLREFGVVSYVVQEKELTDEKVRTVFATAIIIGWTFALTLVLMRGLVSSFYRSDEIAKILIFLSLSFVVYPFGLPATAMLRRERRFGQIATVATSASIANFIVTCSFASMGQGATSLAYGTLASSIILALVALYFWPQHLKLRPSLKAWRQVSSYGIKASAASLISRLAISSPELAIGKIISLHDAAIFTRGRVLALLTERLTTAPILSSALPELANRIRLSLDNKDTIVRITQVTSLLSWSILAFISGNSEQLIQLMYGSQWLGAAALLEVLCLNYAILAISGTAQTSLEASGRIDRVLRNEVWTKIMLVLAVTICSYWSVKAVCWSLVASSALSLVIYCRSIVYQYAISTLFLIRGLSHSFIIAITIYCSQFLLNYLFIYLQYAETIDFIIISLIIKLLISLIITITILKVCKHPFYLEAINTGRTMLRDYNLL